jgi:hypothetical protein
MNGNSISASPPIIARLAIKIIEVNRTPPNTKHGESKTTPK